MNLIHRPMLLQDVDEAIDLIRNAFLFDDPSDRQDLARLWRELIVTDSAHTVVIEDRERPAGRRFLYVRMGVFLTDDFAAEVRQGEGGYVTRRVFDLWRSGRRSFLNAAQIRVANSQDGVCLLAMHLGVQPEMMHPTGGREIRDRIEGYTYQGLAGFRYREIFFEVYGPFQLQWALGLGLALRADNASHFASRGLSAPLPERHPYLMGASPQELEAQHGRIIRHGFAQGRPRFFFKPAERRMLLFAMEGLTDDEVAEYLSVSVAAVRKYWASIYARVGEVDPELLEPASEKSGGTRGLREQKKRRLLNYLRHSIEETRPYAPTPGARY